MYWSISQYDNFLTLWFPVFFRAAMEEQPLVTSQYRELERSKKMLNALNQYKRCVIKVQFPNQLVLQGTFTPLEKVSHVLQFVKKYLQDSTIDFDLCTLYSFHNFFDDTKFANRMYINHCRFLLILHVCLNSYNTT